MAGPGSTRAGPCGAGAGCWPSAPDAAASSAKDATAPMPRRVMPCPFRARDIRRAAIPVVFPRQALPGAFLLSTPRLPDRQTYRTGARTNEKCGAATAPHPAAELRASGSGLIPPPPFQRRRKSLHHPPWIDMVRLPGPDIPVVIALLLQRRRHAVVGERPVVPGVFRI